MRKVNGATGKQIALLLVRKYLYILGAAFAVAISLVYYIINDYTKDFAVKAPIGAGIFDRLHPYLAYLTGYITLAGTQSCPHQSGIDHEERIRLKND